MKIVTSKILTDTLGDEYSGLDRAKAMLAGLPEGERNYLVLLLFIEWGREFGVSLVQLGNLLLVEHAVAVGG